MWQISLHRASVCLSFMALPAAAILHVSLWLFDYYLSHRRIVSTMKPQKNIFLVHCPKNQHGDKLPDNTQSMLFLKE